jgi:hypothetical protein
VPDVLASTANFLRNYGWQRGGAWTPGSANFAVIKEWNKADVYARTIAYFATRLAGGEYENREWNKRNKIGPCLVSFVPRLVSPPGLARQAEGEFGSARGLDFNRSGLDHAGAKASRNLPIVVASTTRPESEAGGLAHGR